MRTQIFRAVISTPFGLFCMAVESDEHGARADLYSAAQSEFRCPIGMIRIKEVKKSNRQFVKGLKPARNCYSEQGPWAWVSEKLR